MFFKLALRNVLANKKRSAITMALGVLSTALLVFSTAWMDGSHQQMIQNAVEIYSGYIQITGADFRESPSYEHLLLFLAVGVKVRYQYIQVNLPRKN